MKISIQQFLEQHSWAEVGQNIARYLKLAGHNVHLCSTNGYTHFPKDLEENIKCRNCINENRVITNCTLDNDYDLQLSYTAMFHWGEYLRHGRKNRFAIYNYDGTVLPVGWSKFYKLADRVLPSSEFSKDIFKKNGVAESIMEVIPHGYNDEFLDRKERYTLRTNRKYKVLVNIFQPHTRKNINGLLEAWGRAFTNKDDVVMIAKVRMKKPTHVFEVSWMDEFLKMKKKYKDHAPISIVSDFIPYISDLYRSCNIGFSCSHVECFNLPALESIISGNITIGSNWGGNVDFMNDGNSLLINGRVDRAKSNMQYWASSVYGECFYPDIDHAAELLRKSVYNYDELKEKFRVGIDEIKENYSWKNIVGRILSLAK